jgi:type IX secretion system PorP/SprF family membrane protein
LFLKSIVHAQQPIVYSQYIFNKAGMNPAASGTDITQKYYYTFGLNNQWLGFVNAPKQSFVNFSYTIRPPRSYKFWQNIGVYANSDQSGLIGNEGIYANYTMHRLLRKDYVISFGAYMGIRKYTRAANGFDPNDPAVYKTADVLYLYPDFIPGLRFAGKKFFMDVSIRQLSVFKLQDFKGRKIGSPSRLQPSVFFDYGKKISLTDRLLFLPSFAVNLPILGIPLLDVNAMFYYANRVGAGLAVRNTNFISGTIQIRFLPNLTAGFSYSYPINQSRYAAPNSFEIMVGVTPMGMNTRVLGKHSVARCPTLDF